ncbi:copper amine oxidase-like protein [Natranaerovirga hydrolytica]|uniref:Copper amine oxidase-like protein n=1 Tax=Natranaerovirga hydrolytica TaxID=680378 RepID=A0A4R1N819_9FIRM|nr:stalk domain-containing protein [Natranaerovirga hydrolytica]TCK98823.1 copper amine oxidase-like protein [Natranaerovirga hydrolytica]
MKKITVIISIIIILLSSTVATSAQANSFHKHTVRPGDTYFILSLMYNQRLNSIESINHINPHQLEVGNLVKINSIKEISVYVNNQQVAFDRKPYIENDRVFVPIRFVMDSLGAEDIQWLQETNTVRVTANNSTIEVTQGSNIAKVNGSNVTLDAPVQLYEDRVFVPIRFFTTTLGIDNIQWDSINYSVLINSHTENLQPSRTFTDDELYWLAKIVHAEAQGEPYEGKLAVANVVINRKNSNQFPNTIYGVIFDFNGGVQFSPVADGAINNEPNEESIRAAQEALNGHNNIGDSLFFLNPAKATSFWIVYNRPYYKTIQGHSFYL